MQQSLLELGKVVNTHGIRGELKIQPWCDDPGIFEELTYVYIGGQRRTLLRCRLHKNCVIAAVEGIETIDAAERLRNQIVTVEREALGELPEGTYYIADLEGLPVRTAAGETLGVIDQVLKTGSNDVYVVERPGQKPLLLPVIDQVIKEVNLQEGYVLAELMKGLVD